MIQWRKCEVHGEVERGGICGSCAVEHRERQEQDAQRDRDRRAARLRDEGAALVTPILARLTRAARAYLLDIRRNGNAVIVRDAIDTEFRDALEAAERSIPLQPQPRNRP